MEVGAVKQAFNNELILLKKKLNQAKIQIIHKLTRKAKTLAEKKASDDLKEKLKRKATAAVNEVLIIKKIKPKDLAKFIVTHKGELNSHLNKPVVDQDKACARLLLHKALQDKYKFIRDRFSSVPINDLLMSREERRKMKKEAKEMQKNKKKGKNAKVVNAEGDWDVEDVEMPAVNNTNNKKVKTLSEDEDGDDDSAKEDISDEEEASQDNLSEDIESVDQEGTEVIKDSANELEEDEDSPNESENDEDSEPDHGMPSTTVGSFVNVTSLKPNKVKLDTPNKISNVKTDLVVKPKETKKSEKKAKDKNKQDKNKNLNEKLLSRKFKKDFNETPIHETKVVDPFFITSTGENYMSVAEPRGPDEVKEVHKQGNRKLRRAVMFGHVPKIKPRKDNYAPDSKFNKQNKSSLNNYNNDDRFTKFNDSHDKRKFTDKRQNFNRYDESKPIEVKPEKLHPSWEAKKRQSGIQPFQGKKIVFEES